MIRRAIAIVTAGALGTLALPMLSAEAATPATARITAGKVGFPSADRSFTVAVTNSDSGNIVTGTRINWVRVTFPADEAGIVTNATPVIPPAGWTSTRTNLGSLQRLTFVNSAAAGGIAPSATQSFTFPATVKAPMRADLTGDFAIAVATDGTGGSTKGATPVAPGDLTANVEVLELLNLRPTAPAPVAGRSNDSGATDGSGTAGQTITYSWSVKNYAQNALSVVPGLSSNGPDTVGAATAVNVPAGGQSDLSRTITLRSGITANATAVITATATAAIGPADAAPLSNNFAVQVANNLTNLTSLDPNRVRSGPDAHYPFQATATKTGTPVLTLESGALNFATTSAPLNGQPVLSGSTTSIAFNDTTVSGTSGSHNASATFSGYDGNGFAFSQSGVPAGTITIDNLLPTLTVPAVKLPTSNGVDQTAAKNGDTITVTGEVVYTEAADMKASSIKVLLDPDVGADIMTTVTTTVTGTTVKYTATASNAQFTRPDPADATKPYTRSFVAKATAEDVAGNIGSNISAGVPVDNILPKLQDPGRTLSETRISVSFSEMDVRGACDPNHWRIDGVPGSVTEVRFENGTTQCNENEIAPGGSGVRVLVLRNAIDIGATPKVDYIPVSRSLNGDPAKDGAANDALQQTISTIVGIAPPAPQLRSFTRNNGSETAYNDAGTSKYYTRFPGNTDFRVCFLGSRAEWKVQVVDGSGKMITETPGQSPQLPAGDNTQCVAVPIGTLDDSYARGIRFLGTNNLEGDIAAFTVVLDTVRPAVALATKNADNTVDVTVNDVIVAGTDFASDWLAYENITNNDGTPGRAYSDVEEVSSPNNTSRKLTVAFRNKGPFGGVGYLPSSSNSKRYEDRAGNQMADAV